MEGFGGLFGDPEELQRRMAEFAEQFQSQQSLAWADNAIKLAVDMTVAAINRVNVQGTTAEQAEQIRAVMATVFPEAVTLVREARAGPRAERPAALRHQRRLPCAGLPARPRDARGPRATTSPNERKPKTKNSAAKPTASETVAIAICWPTE